MTHDDLLAGLPVPDDKAGSMHPEEHADDVVHDLDEAAADMERDDGFEVGFSCAGMCVVLTHRAQIHFDFQVEALAVCT